MREFIDNANSFGTDTALFIELLEGVNEAAAEQGVQDLFNFLRLTGTSMAEFVEVMGQVYGEQSAYLERMDEYEISLDEWYADYLGSGATTFAEWLNSNGVRRFHNRISVTDRRNCRGFFHHRCRI